MSDELISRNSEIKFYLDATGSFDPGHITKTLGIEPSRSLKKGDWVARVGERKSSFDVWSLSPKAIQGEELQDCLRRFLEPFKDKVKSFKTLLQKDSIGFILFIYTSASQRPIIQIGSDILKDLAELGFAIDMIVEHDDFESEIP